MMTQKFKLPTEDSLVLVDCQVHTGTFTFALDTGASHTVIDLTPLLMVGIGMGDSLRNVEFETANGTVVAEVFILPSFSALGKTKTDFEVCAYDFLANGIVSEFDGMLGLDFMKGNDLLVSFKRMEVSLT